MRKLQKIAIITEKDAGPEIRKNNIQQHVYTYIEEQLVQTIKQHVPISNTDILYAEIGNDEYESNAVMAIRSADLTIWAVRPNDVYEFMYRNNKKKDSLRLVIAKHSNNLLNDIPTNADLVLDISDVVSNTVQATLSDQQYNMLHVGTDLDAAITITEHAIMQLIATTPLQQPICDKMLNVRNIFAFTEDAQRFNRVVQQYYENMDAQLYTSASNYCHALRYEDGTILVSRENKTTRLTDMIVVKRIGSNIMYNNGNRPTEMSDILLRLFHDFPHINYILFQPLYLKNRPDIPYTPPMTSHIVPIDVVEVADEIINAIENDKWNSHANDAYFVNIKGWGSVAMAANSSLLTNLNYTLRPIPEQQYESFESDNQSVTLLLDEAKLIAKYCHEANDFAKAIRQYLYNIEQQRELTSEEKELWDTTHNVHVHMNDAGLLLQEKNDEIY